MTATRKEFEEWFLSQYGVNFKYAEFQFDHAPETNFAWQACQSLNNKSIQQLLAVIAKKDELMSQCIENNLHLADGEVCTMKLIKDALAIKPENFELFEVGYIGTESMEVFLTMGMQISPESCDEPVDKLYTIKTKE